METQKDWRALSEAAAREQDPEKLLKLVEELNRVLEGAEIQRKTGQSPDILEFRPLEPLTFQHFSPLPPG